MDDIKPKSENITNDIKILSNIDDIFNRENDVEKFIEIMKAEESSKSVILLINSLRVRQIVNNPRRILIFFMLPNYFFVEKFTEILYTFHLNELFGNGDSAYSLSRFVFNNKEYIFMHLVLSLSPDPSRNIEFLGIFDYEKFRDFYIKTKDIDYIGLEIAVLKKVGKKLENKKLLTKTDSFVTKILFDNFLRDYDDLITNTIHSESLVSKYKVLENSDKNYAELILKELRKPALEMMKKVKESQHTNRG